MKPKKLVLILLGAPGSGKGTQSKLIAKAHHLVHISTGDLLRAQIAKGTEIGLQAKHFIQAGLLVPDEVVMKMLFERVEASDCELGYLLDGFPRTVAQAESLLKQQKEDENVVVINLNVPEEEIVKRATGRLLCRGCGAIYHSDYSAPKESGVCDECGGELYRRSDDDEKVVRERLHVYRQQTEPLISFYEKRGLNHHFDGLVDPKILFSQINDYLLNIKKKTF